MRRRSFLTQVTGVGLSTLISPAAQTLAEPLLLIRPLQPIGSPVLDSLMPVIETSRDVHTHVDKIIELAAWMAYEELPFPDFILPFGMGENIEESIDFSMVANSINFAFTDFRSHVKFTAEYAGKTWSDSDGMFACIKRALDEGVPFLDGKYLAQVTRQDLEHVFRGNIQMPMLDERVEVFQSVGKVLESKYGGRFHNFFQSCSPRLYDNGKGIIDKLVTEFPRYNDVSLYGGHEIKFYKLAQLSVWVTYQSLRRSGRFQVEDLPKMTAFADYIVPVALRVMGIVSYSAALEKAIRNYQLIPRDSTQEIEIRAHSLYATALLREEVNRRRPMDRQVIIPQIDARLWTHYHATHWPHHLTRTIMY